MRWDDAAVVERSIEVASDATIALTAFEHLRTFRSDRLPGSSPDEILLLSGGPISDLSRTSLIAGPARSRIVLQQPDEVEPVESGSALTGHLHLSPPPSLRLTIQSWSAGWQDDEVLAVDDVAAAFDVAASLQPAPPASLWPSTTPPSASDPERVADGPSSGALDVRPGAIAGLLCYDLGRWTQPARLASPPAPGEVLGVLYVVEAWVVHDRIDRRLRLVCSPEHPWSDLDLEPLTAPLTTLDEPPPVACAIGSQSDEEHAERIVEAIEAIRGGHLYQLNYGRRWSAPLADDPWRTMRALAHRNPAPYAGWLHAPDLGIAIASSSPESLLAIDGRTMRTRPIKGTRPRGVDAASDRLLMREMIASRKEVAEHMMLVDLERNDLGRIASPGSVRWSDWRIEALPQVQHMVSEVVADLRADLTLSDAVQAVFPGGSITGCPKAATMAAISELEGSPRGAWTGSLGIHDPRCGMARWNILIRTLEARRPAIEREATAATTDPLVDGGWIGNVQAGGGIVVESSPAREVEEAHWKAAALLDSAWPDGAAGVASPPLATASMASIEPVDERTTSLLERLEAERATAHRLAGAPPIAVGRIDEWRDGADPTEREGARCLLIDNLDSFTWNIAHAVAELGVDVIVAPGRGPNAPAADRDSVLDLISRIDPTHVILGPGPSTPEASPLTLSMARLALDRERGRFPAVLGLCLGHQALGVAAGWQIDRAERGAVHGVPSPIDHDGTGLLGGTEGRTTMMRYHSLTIREPGSDTPSTGSPTSALEGESNPPAVQRQPAREGSERTREGGQPNREEGQPTHDGSRPTEEESQPTHEGSQPNREGGQPTKEGSRLAEEESQPVGGEIHSPASHPASPLIANAWSPAGEVMGIRHPEREIHGVQFHPESCGSPDGLALLQRFLSIDPNARPDRPPPQR